MLNSIGDANCRPAYVERLTAWLDAHPDALDDDARLKRADEPAAGLRREEPGACARRSTDAPKIGESLCDACREHFAAVRALPRRLRRAVHARPDARPRPRLLLAHDLRVRRARRERRTRRSAAAGATTASSSRSAAPPTPGIGFGAGIERLLLALENEGVTAPERADSTSSSSSTARPREQVLALMAELRRRGLACDTDYAGRSLKGQLTQAGRTGAPHGRDRRRRRAPSSGAAGRPRSRSFARGPPSYAQRVTQMARPCAAARCAPRTRAARSRSPAGSRRAATTAGSSSSTSATRRALLQVVINPDELARGGRGRARAAQRVRDPGARRPVVRRVARDGEPGDGDRRDRDPGRGARDPLALDAAAVPARRGGRRRDAAHPLPLARPAPREDAAQHPDAREARLDHPLRDGARRLRRHRDADHGQADARGRPRLPRADAPAAGPVLRAAAEPADLQAAARHLRASSATTRSPAASGTRISAPTGSRS